MRRKANKTCADYFPVVWHPDWKGAKTVVTEGGGWKEVLMRNLIVNYVLIGSACFDPIDTKGFLRMIKDD